MHGDNPPFNRVGPRAADCDSSRQKQVTSQTLFSKSVPANPSPLRFSSLCPWCWRMSIRVEASWQHQL